MKATDDGTKEEEGKNKDDSCRQAGNGLKSGSLNFSTDKFNEPFPSSFPTKKIDNISGLLFKDPRMEDTNARLDNSATNSNHSAVAQNESTAAWNLANIAAGLTSDVGSRVGMSYPVGSLHQNMDSCGSVDPYVKSSHSDSSVNNFLRSGEANGDGDHSSDSVKQSIKHSTMSVDSDTNVDVLPTAVSKLLSSEKYHSMIRNQGSIEDAVNSERCITNVTVHNSVNTETNVGLLSDKPRKRSKKHKKAKREGCPEIATEFCYVNPCLKNDEQCIDSHSLNCNRSPVNKSVPWSSGVVNDNDKCISEQAILVAETQKHSSVFPLATQIGGHVNDIQVSKLFVSTLFNPKSPVVAPIVNSAIDPFVESTLNSVPSSESSENVGFNFAESSHALLQRGLPITECKTLLAGPIVDGKPSGIENIANGLWSFPDPEVREGISANISPTQNGTGHNDQQDLSDIRKANISCRDLNSHNLNFSSQSFVEKEAASRSFSGERPILSRCDLMKLSPPDQLEEISKDQVTNLETVRTIEEHSKDVVDSIATASSIANGCVDIKAKHFTDSVIDDSKIFAAVGCDADNGNLFKNTDDSTAEAPTSGTQPRISTEELALTSVVKCDEEVKRLSTDFPNNESLMKSCEDEEDKNTEDLEDDDIDLNAADQCARIDFIYDISKRKHNHGLTTSERQIDMNMTKRPTSNVPTLNSIKGANHRKANNEKEYFNASNDVHSRQSLNFGTHHEPGYSLGFPPPANNSLPSEGGDTTSFGMKDQALSDGSKMYSKGKQHRSHSKQHSSSHQALPKTSSHHQHAATSGSFDNKSEKQKEPREGHEMKDNMSPFGGAVGRLGKDSTSPFGSMRGAMVDPMLFNPAMNPFLAAGYFGQNFQNPYMPAAAGMPYPQVAAAAAAFGGMLPFSFPDYLYPSASYLSALQEAYASMRTGSASSDKGSAAATAVARGGSANSVTSDKERPNGGGGGASAAGLQTGVGASSGMNGHNANRFDNLWAKMGQGRDASQSRGGGDGGNYDQNGALDLSGGSPTALKRKRSDSEQVGGQMSSKRSSPGSGSRITPVGDSEGLHGLNKRHQASTARTSSSTLDTRMLPSNEASAQFLQQQRYLAELSMRPPLFSPSAAEVIARWTVDDVAKFVGDVDGCSGYAEVFRQLNVTGSALPFLTVDHITQILGMRPEAAQSLRAAIDRILRHSIR